MQHFKSIFIHSFQDLVDAENTVYDPRSLSSGSCCSGHMIDCLQMAQSTYEVVSAFEIIQYSWTASRPATNDVHRASVPQSS